MYLYDLPANRKNVPELIKDPVELIKDVRSLVERHCKDSQDLAITGRPILRRELNRGDNFVLSNRLQVDVEPGDVENIDIEADGADINSAAPLGNGGDFATPQTVSKASSKAHKRNGGVNGTNAPRRRRRRCKTCAPCNSTECGHCTFCLDMVICIITTTYFIVSYFIIYPTSLYACRSNTAALVEPNRRA